MSWGLFSWLQSAFSARRSFIVPGLNDTSSTKPQVVMFTCLTVAWPSHYSSIDCCCQETKPLKITIQMRYWWQASDCVCIVVRQLCNNVSINKSVEIFVRFCTQVLKLLYRNIDWKICATKCSIISPLFISIGCKIAPPPTQQHPQAAPPQAVGDRQGGERWDSAHWKPSELILAAQRLSIAFNRCIPPLLMELWSGWVCCKVTATLPTTFFTQWKFSTALPAPTVTLSHPTHTDS